METPNVRSMETSTVRSTEWNCDLDTVASSAADSIPQVVMSPILLPAALPAAPPAVPVAAYTEASSATDSISQSEIDVTSETAETAETAEMAPVPAKSVARKRPTAGADRLRAYYVKHRQGDMVPKVETVLGAFRGREHVLCHKLKRKYGDWPAL
jgi:hypothetical protein